MFGEARRRHCRRRALCLLGLAVGICAYGQDLDCEAVPEAEQRRCWMVSGCAALGESAAREGCLEALAERQGVPLAEFYAILSAAQPLAEQPVPEVEADASPPPQAESEPVAAPPPTRTAAEPEAERKPRLVSRVFNRLRGTGRKPAEVSPPEPAPATVAPPVAEPAPAPVAPPSTMSVEPTDRFDAEVTMVRRLIHNRQLIALDNGMLFESDRARQSHIEAGDQVRVKRASSRFGRRYQIAGPVRGAVSAIRLRCDSTEASKDTRRKCALLHERGASDG